MNKIKTRFDGFIFSNKVRPVIKKCNDFELSVLLDEVMKETNRRRKNNGKKTYEVIEL